MTIVVINGPNLDRLGKRQPDIYGATTLADVEAALIAEGKNLGHEVECFSSNSEADIVEKVHEVADAGYPIIINPGGLTHTSVVLRDALAEIADGPGFIEVHISNIHARESFRHLSYLSPIAVGVIAGLGTLGYSLALRATIERMA